MQEIRVLHITAHLGGGVGRVLSKVAQLRKAKHLKIIETFVCLEKPKKNQFINVLRKSGIEIVISQDLDEINRLVAAADIVQLEWWHHPLLTGLICTQEMLRARLVVWSHTSGLHYPVIPPSFVSLPHAFIFTTTASLGKAHLEGRSEKKNIVKVINSSGGFDDFPIIQRSNYSRLLRYGYLGALNFVKLHPHILSYIQAVQIPGFAVDIYGDVASNLQFASATRNMGMQDQVRIHGYTKQPAEVIRDMDVFVYLLNPNHYGTTENALLEAMACGVVPIVMDNPVETSIVCHGQTGLVVDSPNAFTEIVTYLDANRTELKKLSNACCNEVRERFSLEKTEQKLRQCYASVMESEKKDFNFQKIFGRTPTEWFLSCLGEFKWCFQKEGEHTACLKRLQHPVLYERSKSSVYHFLRYYPKDPMLRHWAGILEKDLANTAIA